MRYCIQTKGMRHARYTKTLKITPVLLCHATAAVAVIPGAADEDRRDDRMYSSIAQYIAKL